jgi:hypothetical protein
MKKSAILVLLALFCLGFGLTEPAQAAVSGAEPPKCSEPLLITNAGQGPGGKMGRLLITRSGAVKEVTYNAEPQPEDLEAGGFKTMIIVIGSSAKGLGASGITIDQEIARLEKMTTKAKELGIQIIAAHIEGKARRGKAGSADERSIDAILPYASHIIVMKEGDDVDHKFTNFGQEHDIPVTYLDAALDLVQAAEAMYTQ